MSDAQEREIDAYVAHRLAFGDFSEDEEILPDRELRQHLRERAKRIIERDGGLARLMDINTSYAIAE